MGKLDGKVALIIGATSGIGEATVKAYAKEGAKVVVAGRNEEEGKRIAEEIRNENEEVIFTRVDTTKTEEIKSGVKDTLDTYGTLDVLYNGAGVHDSYQNALETDEETYDKVMEVNLKGPYLATKEVLPIFLEKGKGVVINVGSQGTKVAGPGGSTYVTTKHAIEGYTKQLSYDFGQKGIKANVLAPGFVDTPMTEGVEDERLKDIPSARAGKPEEIAYLAVFLGSDESDYMQGTTVVMDGGWLVGR